MNVNTKYLGSLANVNKICVWKKEKDSIPKFVAKGAAVSGGQKSIKTTNLMRVCCKTNLAIQHV